MYLGIPSAYRTQPLQCLAAFGSCGCCAHPSFLAACHLPASGPEQTPVLGAAVSTQKPPKKHRLKQRCVTCCSTMPPRYLPANFFSCVRTPTCKTSLGPKGGRKGLCSPGGGAALPEPRAVGRAAPGSLGTRPRNEATAPGRRHRRSSHRASSAELRAGCAPASARHGPAPHTPAPVTQRPPRRGPSAARGRERCPQPLPGKARGNATDRRREPPPAGGLPPPRPRAYHRCCSALRCPPLCPDTPAPRD